MWGIRFSHFNSLNMKTSDLGISLVKHFESLHDGDLKKIGLQPKQDPISIWTCGYGHALKDIDGSWLKGVEGYQRMLEIYPDLETITEEEAEDLLEEDLEYFEDKVNSLKLKLTQYQFDAIISFCFNCGFGSFLSSTLLRRIKGEKGSIAEAFLMWCKSGGRELKGLKLRRESESILYSEGILNFK